MSIRSIFLELFQKTVRPEPNAEEKDTKLFVPRKPETWTEYIYLRKTGKEENVPRLSKIEVAVKAREAGLRTADIYRIYDDPQDFDDAGLPDVFVLKPACLWSKHGVMLLQRHNTRHKFLDFMSGRWLTIAQIRAEQCSLQKRWYKYYPQKKSRFQLVAQEMIRGENAQGRIPYDYKLYTFDGEVRLIVQINRNTRPASVSWFLNEFEIFDFSTCIESAWKTIKRGKPDLPECHKEIIAAAKTISKALKTPFISADMYATPDGPVIGELTSAPGGPYYGMFRFKPHFDRDLGKAWTDANLRLGHQIPLLYAEIPETRKPPVI
jgi:hypothetical protein